MRPSQRLYDGRNPEQPGALIQSVMDASNPLLLKRTAIDVGAEEARHVFGGDVREKLGRAVSV